MSETGDGAVSSIGAERVLRGRASQSAGDLGGDRGAGCGERGDFVEHPGDAVSLNYALKRLGDVCEIDKDQGFYSDLPYVGLEQIESGEAKFLGDLTPQSVKSATFRFSPRHLLYGRLRPYLNKVLIPNFSGHCSTEIFPLMPSRDLLREYLCYWLRSDETVRRISDTSTGARMPRAEMNKVMEFSLPVPPVAEQRRIVGILDEAFAGLEAMRANAEKNLSDARAIFECEFNRLINPVDGSWSERPLDALCNIKHGFAFDGAHFTNEGDFVLMTPGNFYEAGGYRDRGTKQKYYVGDVPDGYVLSKGDLLVAMTEQAVGLLGSPAIVPESGIFLHNQRLGLVTPKSGDPWATEFFFHVFNADYVRAAIQDSASGTKVRHTSPTKIGEIVVKFPNDAKVQVLISQKVEQLGDEIKSLQASYVSKLAALAALRQSLLHQAFSGSL